MPRGDLGPPPPCRQLLQRLLERQPGLLRIPSVRHTSRDILAAIDLHPEAIEAERARAMRERLGLVAKPVSRFACGTAGTEWRPWPRRRTPRDTRGATIERQLLISFFVSKCVCHARCPHVPTVWERCDRLGQGEFRRGQGGKGAKGARGQGASDKR